MDRIYILKICRGKEVRGMSYDRVLRRACVFLLFRDVVFMLLWFFNCVILVFIGILYFFNLFFNFCLYLFYFFKKKRKK